MSDILDVIERERATAGERTDKWLSDNVLRPFTTIDKELRKRIKSTARMIRGLHATKYSLVRANRLEAVRSLCAGAAARLSNIAVNATDVLRDDLTYIYREGVESASRIAVAQFDLPIEIRKKFESNAAGRVPVVYSKIRSRETALPTKAHNLGPIVADKLEKKLSTVITVARDATIESHISKAVDSFIGTGLMYLLGMFSLALWTTYVDGILGFSSFHEWINGWIWSAVLDRKTCAACIYLHGQWFTADVEFHDHPHGRCMPVPAAVTLPWWYSDIIGGDLPKPTHPDIPPGEDWFETLSADEQENILGPAAYAAWAAGVITLRDLTENLIHDVYGTIIRTASLKSILGEEAENFYH